MNIKGFANNFIGSGVKPSLFEVTGQIGQGAADAQKLVPFLCRAAALPGSNLGTIEVPYRGRRLKVPGDRQFTDWTIQLYNDGDFKLRNAFESWMNLISQMERNTPGTARENFTGFRTPVYCDWTVNQLDRNGKPIKTYKLIGCFPTNISDIAVSYDATDQIEEFSVTLAYTYFLSNAGTDTAVPLPSTTVTPGG